MLSRRSWRGKSRRLSQDSSYNSVKRASLTCGRSSFERKAQLEYVAHSVDKHQTRTHRPIFDPPSGLSLSTSCTISSRLPGYCFTSLEIRSLCSWLLLAQASRLQLGLHAKVPHRILDLQIGRQRFSRQENPRVTQETRLETSGRLGM